MEQLWSERTDSAKDYNGADHRLKTAPYNNFDADPGNPGIKGPFGAAGLHAFIEGGTGNIDVWLLCSQAQWDYYSGEAEKAAGAPVDDRELQARRSRVLEDLTVKVKLAYRAGQLTPGDEIHVRLGPDVRVPAYGPEWRRALRED